MLLIPPLLTNLFFIRSKHFIVMHFQKVCFPVHKTLRKWHLDLETVVDWRGEEGYSVVGGEAG